MFLHSPSFVFVFCPLVVAVYAVLWRLGLTTGRRVFLLVASIAFYALAGLPGLPVLAASVVLNYFVARRVTPASPSPRRWLVFGIVANVTLLAAFKYTAFVVANLAAVSGSTWEPPRLVLPLGISFFSVAQIIYLMDCYEELTTPAPLLDHALFGSFFPTITAGPITRGSELIPQLESAAPTADGAAAGVVLFVFGLTKKVVVADTFGRLVDFQFSSAQRLGLVDGWATAFSYAMQLYYDFSGYSDMAIAVGLMLGLRLPVNFNAPFRALSVVDFWKRWHISLSTFITTYLYTPLARRFRPLTFPKAMAVTVVSMAIAGLWHGPAWTYIVFGVVHGAGMVASHVWRRRKLPMPRAAGWALTLVFVVAAFVVFRAADLAEARAMFAAMLGLHGLRGPSPSLAFPRFEWFHAIPIMAIGALAALVGPTSSDLVARFKPSKRWVVGCSVAILVCVLFMNTSATKGFIYRGF